MTILSILNELEAESSTNEKVRIIEREKNNELLKRVFYAAYNPMIVYGIKKIPVYVTISTKDTLNNALNDLFTLSNRTLTGNNAIGFLSDTLANLSEDDAEVLCRVIKKDLRCGTSDTLASRVWPGFVPTFDVMLSHADISGIKFPAYAQIKSDGARCHMSLIGGKAVAFSRNGKPIELHGTFDAALALMINDGETLDGELLAMRDGKILPRKTGNGIVNKAVKSTIGQEEAEMLVFHTWDIVDFSSTIPYKERIERLTKLGENVIDKISVLDTIIVNGVDEAQLFFEQCLEAGEEGAMIKNINAVWQPKRTKDLGKMKASEVADLVVVGVVEGEGKYIGSLGALICETSDTLLQVKVGTGFSDEDRREFWQTRTGLIGEIIEVKYNQIITSKGKDTTSLFLPVFMGVRVDKTCANAIGELK